MALTMLDKKPVDAKTTTWPADIAAEFEREAFTFEYSGDGYSTTGCFASRHPGGAHFVFGDGRVEFVNEDIAIGIYQAAATRAGGDDGGQTGTTTPQPGCT